MTTTLPYKEMQHEASVRDAAVLWTYCVHYFNAYEYHARGIKIPLLPNYFRSEEVA